MTHIQNEHLQATQKEKAKNYSFVEKNVQLLIVIAILISLGVAPILAFNKDRMPVWAYDSLFAIVTGFLGSAILLFLFGIIQEKNARQIIQDQMSIEVGNKLKTLLKNYFEQSLPLEVYERAKTPTEAFRNDFVKQCLQSKKYVMHGVGGDFTVFRLSEHINKEYIAEKQEIRFHLLDPREGDLLLQRAELEVSLHKLKTKKISDTITDLKDEIFCTLCSLYNLKDSKRFKVILHKDSPFYRAELFDNAIFLSFYLGGEYPGTLLFEKDTHIYRAFEICLLMSEQNRSLLKIDIHSHTEEEDFMKFMKKIGCKESINDLKIKAQARLDRIKEELDKSGFLRGAPF
jgi:hypothetical protein